MARRGKGSAWAAALAAAGALLAGCGSDGGTAPSVEVLAADSTGVTPGAAYAWRAVSREMDAARDPRLDTPALQERIRAAIDKALGEKGYARAGNPAEAQLEVAYRLGVMQGYDQGAAVPRHGGSAGFGGPGGVNCNTGGCVSTGWVWGAYGAPEATLAAATYTEGALMVDVFDRPTGRLVWQAIYKARVYGKEDGTQEALDRVARQLLKELPGTTAAP